MATNAHALVNTDTALVEFFNGELEGALAVLISPGDPSKTIVPGKNAGTKTLPVIICESDTAKRTRAKNWEITGRITVKTPFQDAKGVSLIDSSKALEFAVLGAMEQYIPADDQPQPLAAAINAAAAEVLSDNFLLTKFFITDLTADQNEEGTFWVLTIGFTATCLNDSKSAAYPAPN